MSEFKELGGKCRQASRSLHQASTDAINKLALTAKNDQLAAARATGVGGSLSGSRNAKLSVGYKLMEGTPASAVVRWRGPAHLVNNPTKAHDIVPRKFAGTRGTGRKAQKGAGLLALFGTDAHAASGGIKLADGQIRHSVHHPGTHGKHFFQAGVAITSHKAGKVLRNEVVRSLSQVFTGG